MYPYCAKGPVRVALLRAKGTVYRSKLTFNWRWYDNHGVEISRWPEGSLCMKEWKEDDERRWSYEYTSNHFPDHLEHLNIKFTASVCETAPINTTSVIKKARSNIFRWYSDTNYVQPSFSSNEKKRSHRSPLFLFLPSYRQSKSIGKEANTFWMIGDIDDRWSQINPVGKRRKMNALANVVHFMFRSPVKDMSKRGMSIIKVAVYCIKEKPTSKLFLSSNSGRSIIQPRRGICQ